MVIRINQAYEVAKERQVSLLGTGTNVGAKQMDWLKSMVRTTWSLVRHGDRPAWIAICGSSQVTILQCTSRHTGRVTERELTAILRQHQPRFWKCCGSIERPEEVAARLMELCADDANTAARRYYNHKLDLKEPQDLLERPSAREPNWQLAPPADLGRLMDEIQVHCPGPIAR